MPDSPDFDFEAARRSLDAVPAPDLWDDAQRRVAGGEVVPLVVGGERPRHPGRWLAVAAAAVLTVGAVAVLAMNEDDQPVDTGPWQAWGDDEITLFESGDCMFGVTHPPGEPAHRATDGDQQPRLDDQPSTRFGLGETQNALVHVPGYDVRDLLGERLEDVELARGTAQLWFTPTFVQVRWFPSAAHDDPCESFTVTVGATGAPTSEDEPVATATEDENRRGAIDFAERIVLQSELPPEGSPSGGNGPTMAVGAGDCSFGVSGEPIVLLPGPADPPLFDAASRAPGTTIVHTSLGTQVAELQVPGLVVNDLLGERVEQVELQRGTAEVWFDTAFVQVRWFSGSQADCDSFTVTMTGGTEDGNRHAAVDLAERILLPAELPGGALQVLEVVAGDWQLERATVDGVPTDGDGLTFGFVDGQARWTDGCNDFAGTYEGVGATTMRVIDVVGTKVTCPPNPTAEAVSTVMNAEQIEVTAGSGRDILVLSTGTTVLTLVPIDPQTTTSTFVGVGQPIPERVVGAQPSEGYAIWPITYPGQPQGYWDFAGGSAEETARAYAIEALGWRDAVVTDAEPSEDGWSGSRYIVESAELGGEVSVSVRLGTGGDGNIVYGVDVPARLENPEAGASLLVSGRTARASVVPSPFGTSSVGVKLVYGDEVLGEGGAGEDVALTRAPDTPGAVSVYFVDASGRVISAWARPLPVGDFAAG